MNKFKKINVLKILVFILPVLVFGTKVYGADLEIVCDNIEDGDQCDIVSGDKVFNESNWLPGYSVTKTISVRNDDKNDDCSLKMYTSNEVKDPSNFAERIFTALKKNGSLFYGDLDLGGDATSDKTLQNIFDSSYISFGVVTQDGGTVLYEWTATFDSTAGNDFQDAETVFDISINFTCDHDISEGGGGDDSGGGDDKKDTLLGAATSFFAPFFGGPVVETEEVEEEVAGVTTEKIPEEMVKGAGICVDPWWWWLVFILQFIIHWFIYKTIKEKHIDTKKRFYVLQVLNTGVFMYIFWKNFCPWWDVLVSMVIGLVWLFLTKRKFDKLEKSLSPRRKYIQSK